jgi:DNA-binding response OmpR family regulator
MRVLVVEDQAELADDIAEGLRDRGIGEPPGRGVR